MKIRLRQKVTHKGASVKEGKREKPKSLERENIRERKAPVRYLHPADGVASIAIVGPAFVLVLSSIIVSVCLSASGVALFSWWAFGFCSRRRIFFVVGVRLLFPAWFLSVKGERSALVSVSSCLAVGGGISIRVCFFVFFVFRFGGFLCGWGFAFFQDEISGFD